MTRNYQAETAASITALAKRIMDTNLCEEIVGVQLMPNITYRTIKLPEPKYKFSREWYVAEYDWVHHGEVLEWCKQQFGPHPQNPDAWSRWCNYYSERIHFRDQKDYHWFILRWGG